MGRVWRETPHWQRVVEAEAVTGRPVGDLLCNADADVLDRTDNAQLCTYVVSIMAFDALSVDRYWPAVFAGHSLGEYSALTAAGYLGYEDGLRLVVARGDLTWELSRRDGGSMAAILGLPDLRVEQLCEEQGPGVWPANFNAPGQVVISGQTEAVDRVVGAAPLAGAIRAVRLAITGGFHCPMMEPAEGPFGSVVNRVTFDSGHWAVVANLDGAIHHAPSDWPPLLARQLSGPVRWTATMETLVEECVSTFIGVGPGRVLTGLAKRTARGMERLDADAPETAQGIAATVRARLRAG